jgi:hypothetical protein
VLQAWVDFLQSFGLQEQQLADLLRSSPELFYSSNIFQVRGQQGIVYADASQIDASSCHLGLMHCL